MFRTIIKKTSKIMFRPPIIIALKKNIARTALQLGKIITHLCKNNPDTAARTIIKMMESEAFYLAKNAFRQKYLAEKLSVESSSLLHTILIFQKEARVVKSRKMQLMPF